MAKVLIHFQLQELRWPVPPDELAGLRARFPNTNIVHEIDEGAALREIEDADVFFGWTLPEPMLRKAKRLKWFQSANAGMDKNLYPEMVESSVTLTNSAGAHSVNIPEHVIAQMLTLARNFNVAARLQVDGKWDRAAVISSQGGLTELEGATALILGVGAIGGSLAHKLAALGMRVQVVRRTPKALDSIDVYSSSKIDELLPSADFVILALPLTPETRGLISSARIARMKPSAYLINIARGEVIDQGALIEALKRGAIAGAALDVFAEEPLPPSSPLWKLENAVLTPHIAGGSPKYFNRIVSIFADNLERYLGGQSLNNQVDKRLGYAPGK